MTEQDFNDYIEDYTNLIKVGKRILYESRRMEVLKGRNTLAFSALDKMTITFSSIKRLLPSFKEESFDISSISSLVRTTIELSNKLFFFGLEKVDENEEKLRVDLFSYLSKKERQAAVKKLNPHITKLTDWELEDKHLIHKRNKIISNPTFIKLIQENKIQGFDSLINELDRKNKYWGRNLLFKKRNLNVQFLDSVYKINSFDTHGSPAAIERHIQNFVSNSKDTSKVENHKQTISIAHISASLYAKSIMEYSKISSELEESIDQIEKELLETLKELTNEITTKS